MIIWVLLTLGHNCHVRIILVSLHLLPPPTFLSPSFRLINTYGIYHALETVLSILYIVGQGTIIIPFNRWESRGSDT